MGGRNLGRYRLVEKLAIGGMAEVWRARQKVVEGVERDVVIKRILPHFLNDPDFVQMFLNEARVAARFNHSNIAQIYDVGELGGTYFIAMEYVQGADLGRVMRKAWTMGHWVARPLAIRIIACCCEGLAYAHTRLDDAGRPLNVVHRDVSPANILVSVDGAVKLTDFGIAKASDLVSVTRAGSIKGKFAYMSPEQARGLPVDRRSDLFSVALVLYELLTGVRPLRRETDAETHAAAVQCEIQAPSEVSDVPPELDGLVMRALAKRPDDRYPDVHAFRMALEELLVEQRWVATSSQIAELMRILFAEGIKPELPPGVSQEDDLGEMLGDTHSPPAKSATAPARRPSLGEGPQVATEQHEAERPGPPVPDEERDLYGEDDPLPYDDAPPAPAAGGHTAPTPKTPAWTGPPRRLEFLEGPDQGLVVRLLSARLVVGRVSDCQVNLKDRSISRRHLELAQSEDGVMLRDLASGNGTRVNGEDISERLLRHGDVVELGNTRFQFIDEEEEQRIADAQIAARLTADAKKEPSGLPAPPPPPAGAADAAPALPLDAESEAPPAPRVPPLDRWRALPRRTRQIIAGSGAGVLLLLVIAAIGPGGNELDPKQELAQRRLAQAKTALQEGRREQAAALATSADRLWPGTDMEGIALQARRDQDAAERLRRAKLALDAEDLDGAHAALTPADPVSIELVNEKRELTLRLVAARHKEQERAFEEAVRTRAFPQARALLAAFEGDQREVAIVRLEEAEARAKEDAASHQAYLREEQEAAVRRQREARVAALEAIFRPVELRVQALDYHRAVLATDRVIDEHPSDPEVRARANLLKRMIPTFGRTYELAQTELRNGQSDRAARNFKKARELLAQLGFGGALDVTLQRHVVEASVEAGRRAFDARRDADAAEHYRTAAKFAPKDRRVYEGLKALEARAGDMYREAQVLQSSNPARASDKLRQVVAITRPGTDLHGRAKNLLRQLNRLTAGDE